MNAQPPCSLHRPRGQGRLPQRRIRALGPKKNRVNRGQIMNHVSLSQRWSLRLLLAGAMLATLGLQLGCQPKEPTTTTARASEAAPVPATAPQPVNLDQAAQDQLIDRVNQQVAQNPAPAAERPQS